MKGPVPYVFSFELSLPSLAERLDDYLADLADAGCKDAGARVVDAARLELTFRRSGVSAPVVMKLALGAVRRALPHAVLMAVGPDVLALEGIAHLVGLPGRCLHELRAERDIGFPAPISHEAPLRWRAAHVLHWIHAVGAITVDAPLLETTDAAHAFNLDIHARRLGLVAA